MANLVFMAALAFPKGHPALCTDVSMKVTFVVGHFGGLQSRLELAFEEQDAENRLLHLARDFDAP
jgi:hypothetical protein